MPLPTTTILDSRESERLIVAAMAEMQESVRQSRVAIDECRESIARADEALKSSGWLHGSG